MKPDRATQKTGPYHPQRMSCEVVGRDTGGRTPGPDGCLQRLHPARGHGSASWNRSSLWWPLAESTSRGLIRHHPGRPGYPPAMDGSETITASRTNGDRPECALERADRNMNELLQELRVAQTGVQILFAFLLTLVFQQRFADITEAQRWTYVVTLLLSVVTAGLLVAPAAVHRVTFQRGLKMETVLLGHRLFTAGLAMLAVTLAGGVLLVLDVAVGRWFAIPVALASLLLLLSLWYLLPLPLLKHARGRPGAARPAATR
jgi:hypothetical protein